MSDVNSPTPDTAALRQAAQAARDAAAAQRWDDLAARLHYEGDQVSSDPTRLRYAELLWRMAGQLQGAAEGLRALAAGEPS